MNYMHSKSGAQPAAHPLGPLAPLAERPQFIIALRESKLPCDYRTGTPCNAHDPSVWTTWEAAAHAAANFSGQAYGVGFVLTEADDFVVVDVDHCLRADGTWSQLAHELCSLLPGAVVEASQSGRGLHLWLRSKAVPTHTSKNTALGIECYSSKRYVMLGSGAAGVMAADCPGIRDVVDRYFKPNPAAAGAAAPRSGPRADWAGPDDDAALLALARAWRPSPRAVFGAGVTFADLYDGNVAALARRWPAPGRADGLAYDASSADAALAQHLAFLTGCDADRMARLLRGSALARPKHDREDYVARTVEGACARQAEVLQQRPAPSSPAQPSSDAARPFTMILADDPLRTARALIAAEYTHGSYSTLKDWQSSFYRWTGAAWAESTLADIKSKVYAFIDANGFADFRPTQRRVGDVVDALRHASEVHVDSAFSAPGWLDGVQRLPADEVLACSNGLLHIPTRTVHPPSPLFFNLNAVPYAFEPNAPAPLGWLRFLADVWPNDPEAIATLQEVFGYMLTADTSQQKIFLIIGPKRSGKGTIARVLREMLGAANVTGPTLSSLATQFGLAPLVGKLAAIVSDARLGGKTDPKQVAENLLRISGEDSIDIDRKFLPAMTTRLGVRFLMLTNELPKIADASGAMASRFVILKMDQSFFGREDPGLTDRLLQELPGILAWAVEGWHRLNARGHFVEPKSSAETVQELADLGSPISAFVRDECTVGATASVTVDALYQAWTVWCAREGNHHPGTRNVFGRDLTAAFPAVTRARPRVGAEREWVYRGIGLRGPHGPHTTSFQPPYAATHHSVIPTNSSVR